VVLHALGAARFGMWIALVVAVSFTGLLDFGFSQAVARFAGEHRARRNATAVNSFIVAMGAAYAVAFVLVLAMTVGIGLVFPVLIRVPAGQQPFVLPGAVLIGIATALGLWMGFFTSILHSHQRLAIANAVRAGYWVCFTLLTSLAALLGLGITGLAAAMAVTAALTCVALGVLVTKSVPGLRVRRPELAYLRQALRYSVFMFLVSAGAAVVFETDTLVIAAFVGTAAVTSYAVTLRLTRGLTGFLHKVTDVLFPFYAGMRAAGDTARMRENFLATTRIEFAGAILVALGLIFVGQPLVALWVGASNVASAGVFGLAIALIICEAVVHPGAVLAAATGGERPMAIVNNTEALVNLALSIALALRFGVVGVIGATVLAQALTNLWFLPRWAMSSLRINLLDYLRATALRSIAPALAGSVTGFLIVSLWPSTPGRFLAAIGCTAVFVGVYLRTAAGHIERGWARALRLPMERAA
jgi:O-antigen/teichoic acid export membrane protein